MKKILTIACVLMVATSLFAAPKKAKKAKKGAKNQVVLNVFGYGDNSNSEGQTFKRIVDEFMAENPDIKIDYELLYDEAYHQKAVSRLAAGDVPDVAYMGADARWGAEWQEAGQQIDNCPYMPANIDQSLIPDFFIIFIF